MKTHGQIQSQKHEKRLASKHEGQVSAGSGSFWSRKNDVRSSLLLIEHKYTAALKGITIKAHWLVDLWSNAISEGRIPVLAFHLAGRDYVILSEDDFDELLERAHGVAGDGEVLG